MLRAHRQAWCWQDEYYGLTMDDIRRLEKETQMELQQKMRENEEGGGAGVQENGAMGNCNSNANQSGRTIKITHLSVRVNKDAYLFEINIIVFSEKIIKNN